MPVKSLMELATTVCIKNIRGLDSVGDFLPYENVRQILLRVDNAHQLRQIELNSPQIDGETGEIWLKLIEREFPMEYKAKAYKPSNPKKWYRVWEKYKKDHVYALEESERKLMSALAGLRQDKEKNTSRITDRKLDKKLLPRTPGFGVAKKGWGPRDHTVSNISFNRGTRTKTNTGTSVMRKVRREVKEIANIHGSLSRPSQRSGSAITQPVRAPAAMVNDYRRAAQPVYRPTPKSEQPSIVEEYEERATFLSDSEDDDDDEPVDLFDDDDDDEPSAPRDPAPKSFAKSSTTSLLKKRPGAASSSSPTKSQASSRPAPKRSGLLSNSYKPKTQAVSSSSTASASSSKPTSSAEPPRPAQHLPRTQSSPPPASIPGPSSPPPASIAAGPPRKRKAVDIFMKRKKRA